MDFITGKHIQRRTFLRGMGATVALPFLDAMIPAGRSLWGTAGTPTRLVAIEMVHGAAGCNEWGAKQNLWSPQSTGRDFDLGPTALKALAPYKDYLTVVSNTDIRQAEAMKPEEIGGDHFRSSATFLTQMHCKQTEGSDVLAGTSLDQMYAQRFGQDTPIPSMQLCIENVDQAGGCAYGYACVYTDSISWASPTEPLPVIRDPRVAFDMLFGAGGTPEARAQRRRTNQSILDYIAREMDKMQRSLGPEDRQRMDKYMEDIRELERRIQRVEARNTSGEARELPGAPAGVPDSFDEHVKLMYDIQALAFASDMTRVFSFKLGRDGSGRVYPESGSDQAFHNASHHGGNPDRIKDFARINAYHVSTLTYLFDKLKGIQEPGGNLLDQSLILYGSPMGDPNVHNHRRIPLFAAGKAGGKLPGGLHIKAADGTPTANAMLSMLHALGLEDLKSFGDSNGELSLTSAVADAGKPAAAGSH